MLSNVLIQFALLSVVAAEEVLMSATTTTHGNAWKYGSGGGVIGFAVLIMDILAIMEVLKSNRAPSHKLLWSLIIFIFPILGLIFYWLFANRAAHSGSGEYEAIP